MDRSSEARVRHSASLKINHQHQTTKSVFDESDHGYQISTKESDHQGLTPWKAYLHLWSYADNPDIVLRIIGIASALGAGSAYPLMTIIFGDLVNAFNDIAVGIVSPAEFRSVVDNKTLWFVYLFIGKFSVSTV